MAQQLINVNSPINYNPTDPRRTAYTKVNENFTELYERIPVVVTVGDTAPSNPSVGDLWVDTN